MRLSQTAVLKRSTKGAMTGFFRRAHQQRETERERERERESKNEMRKQFGLSAGKNYQ